MVRSLPIRIIVRTYQWHHKPIHPSKVFKNEKEALQWLGDLGADLNIIKEDFKAN